MPAFPRVPGLIACCFILAATPTIAIAQAAPPAKPPIGSVIAPAKVFGEALSRIERQLVPLVEAMPEEKFNFAPATTMGEYKGVSSFAEQVKHLAEANSHYLHDPAKPAAMDHAAFENLKTKAEIVKALKDSFVDAHTFIDSLTPENAFVVTPNGTRVGMALIGMGHCMDHYGQLVEYLRMNGIVPPASRRGN